MKINAETLQVVGDRRENHCAHYWWVPHRVVGWVSGYFWGGQQARALARFRRGCPELFRIESPLRRDAARRGEARNRMNRGAGVGGEGTERGRGGKRGRGGREGGGRNHLPAYVICPAYVEPQAVRENRSSETGNRLSVRQEERKSETNPVTSPETHEETSVFVIRKCSRKRKIWAPGVGSCRHETARFDFIPGPDFTRFNIYPSDAINL